MLKSSGKCNYNPHIDRSFPFSSYFHFIFFGFIVICCRDVEQSLQKANELYKKWNLNKRPDEAKWQAEQLKTILSSIDDDIEDLDETIRAAEANPARFNLHPSELSGRRDFVGRTRNTISVNNPTFSLSTYFIQSIFLVYFLSNQW